MREGEGSARGGGGIEKRGSKRGRITKIVGTEARKKRGLEREEVNGIISGFSVALI